MRRRRAVAALLLVGVSIGAAAALRDAARERAFADPAATGGCFDPNDNDAAPGWPWILDGVAPEGLTTGGDSCDPDDDNSGCVDVVEPLLTPPRHPLNPLDFPDVPVPALPGSGSRGGAVTIGDALATLAWTGATKNGPPNTTGHDYDDDSNANGVEDGLEYDRSPTAMPGISGAPNGAVSIQDVLVVLAQAGDVCIATRSYAMGWAATPPVLTTESVIATAQSMAAVSEYALIQREVPWSRLLAGEDMNDLLAEEAGLANYLRFLGMDLVWLIDPLNGLDRTEEAPDLVAAGHSLLDPAIRGMHEAWVRGIADLYQPEWFGLASEINTLAAHGDVVLYDEIVDMVNELAPDIRSLSPGTQVFVSFQMEDAWELFPLPSAVDHFTLIDDFDIDALGLSSYPVFQFADPADMPANYYERFDDATTLPLIQVEGGWSTATTPWGSGTLAEQVNYFKRVGAFLDGVSAKLWVMLFYADLDLGDPSWNLTPEEQATLQNFASMGIVDVNLAPKFSYVEWTARFGRPLVP